MVAINTETIFERKRLIESFYLTSRITWKCEFTVNGFNVILGQENVEEKEKYLWATLRNPIKKSYQKRVVYEIEDTLGKIKIILTDVSNEENQWFTIMNLSKTDKSIEQEEIFIPNNNSSYSSEKQKISWKWVNVIISNILTEDILSRIESTVQIKNTVKKN